MRGDFQGNYSSEEDTELGIKFIFKFIFALIVAVFFALPSIFFPDLRNRVKKPFLQLIHILLAGKITLVLIILNVLVFFLVEPFLIENNILNSISSLALVITGIKFLDILLNILFTAFLHSGLVHLGGNMLALFIFGNIIEKYLPRRYLLIYFGSHFLGSVISFLFEGPGIGASAAISGLIFAAILIKPLYFSFVNFIPLPIFIIGWTMIYGDFVSFIARANDGVGHLAHIGGYVAGFIVSLFFVGREDKEEIRKGLIINILGIILFLIVWFFILKK